MFARFRSHWPEYAMEAAGLGLFMLSASVFAILIHHPDGPVYPHVPEAVFRRMLMGAAMGLTAMGLIYSPIGARSGAHINPSTTLTFFRLGRVHGADAAAYAVSQFAGGLAGIGLAAVLLSRWIGGVHYVATLPGPWGHGPAFLAEVVITFVLMSVVLRVSNHPRWSRWTGVAVGLMVATYITIEDPISGMSMNPARSFGPAVFEGSIDSYWIYLLAPPIGMLAAAEVYVRQAGLARVFCAKLHHHTDARCIFNCRFDQLAALVQPTDGPRRSGDAEPTRPDVDETLPRRA